MKKISKLQAQEDVDAIRKEAKNKRPLRADAWPQLRRHGSQILAWANAKKSSRAMVARLIRERLSIQVTESQVYRFVKSLNHGAWTHTRQKNI